MKYKPFENITRDQQQGFSENFINLTQELVQETSSQMFDKAYEELDKNSLSKMIDQVVNCFDSEKPENYSPMNSLLHEALSGITKSSMNRELLDLDIESVVELAEELMEL